MKARPLRNPEFFVQEMQEEILLYKPGSLKTVYLNETAALVWKLCDGTRTLQDLAGFLSAHYPNSAAEVVHDTDYTVAALVNEGALLLEE